MAKPIPKQFLSQRVKLSKHKLLPQITTCAISYSTEPVPVFSTQIFIDNPLSILHTRFKDEVRERRRDTLWQTFTANTMAAKKCVRLKCSRRLRVSFREALKERGYKSNGTAMKESGPGLTGSIAFVAAAPALDAPYAELKKQMRLVVQYIEARITNHRKKQMKK